MSSVISTLDWKELIVQTLDNKLARDIKSLHINSPFAEWFIIATATSSRHLWALCGAVEHACKEHGVRPKTQGRHDDTQWIVLNADGLFIHLFQEDARSYYQIEELWQQHESNHNPSSPHTN
jgi:ribosome-associated protein